MKKVIALCMILLLITGLGACGGTSDKDSIIFYYPRVSYLYDDTSGVIGKEDTALFKNTLSIEEILQHYLKGPDNKDLHSPLTGHVQLKNVVFEKETISITLSDSAADLSPANLSSALASLALTCFEIFGANKVLISGETVLIDGEQAVVFTKNNILLWDSYILNPPATQPTEQGE